MSTALWSSLNDQLTVAEVLYGAACGRELLGAWLDEQEERVDNPAFGNEFAQHVTLPGIHPTDYSHRRVHCRHGNALGGIRFFRRDVTRPFVEIIAHTFDDLGQLRDCVAAEWAAFNPHHLRLRTRPGRLAGPHVRLDVTIHAAEYCAMSRPAATVSLQPFDNADDAIAMVHRRFDDMKINQPLLHRDISPAQSEDIRAWHREGHLMAIVAADRVVGLLAVAPGCVEWVEGDVINEEIVEGASRGHGYAAAAQATWAASAHRRPETLLIGTIDRLNTASRKTAQRAGRPIILEDHFIRLA
ncbi:hypothetical protein [Mycobacterium sp. 141]|uniref:hypothetical protein n=1 Tax=Mycobacterium sp. 141 TaxID=1120797 RepID=UPI00037EB107|nr:hypothetical protein [Mycobacterium sp. 141]